MTADRKRIFAAMLPAAAVLFASGCYSAPYQPYPAYQGPAAPINTLQPGPYYAPGQPLPNAPSYNGNFAPTPSGGLSPTPASPTPTFENGGGGFGGDSGGFDPGSGGTDFENDFSGGGSSDPYYPGGGGGVPNYPDPTSDFQDPVRPTNGDEFDAFRTPGPSASLQPAGSLAPPEMTVSDARPMPLSFDDAGSAFENAGEPIAQTAYVPETAGETQLDPYAYEAGTYAWLRGVVSKDLADGSWSITYDLEPEPFDTFGGNLTLAADSRLDGLADGDVILVEGRVDQTTADRLGKPIYRAGEIVPLGVNVPE